MNDQRLGAVVSAIEAAGARSVVDLGCGEGNLIEMLMRERGSSRASGRGRVARACWRGRARSSTSTGCPRGSSERIELLQGSLAVSRRAPERLRRGVPGGGDRAPGAGAPAGAGARRVRVRAAGHRHRDDAERRVQRQFDGLPAGRLRHRDHRFEWTRAEFEAWARRVGGSLRLRACRFVPVGPEDRGVGAPTQMGVFVAMNDRNPRALAGRARRRLRRRQSRPSRGSTSSRRRCSRRTPAAASSPTTRTTRARPPTPSRSCTSSRPSVWRAGRLTVVDATNVQPEARKPLVALARELPLPAGRDRLRHAAEGSAHERNRDARRPRLRRSRGPPPARASCAGRCTALRREGFRHVFVLDDAEEVESAVDRAARRCGTTARDEHGPVRHHRRRPRLLRRAASSCSSALGYDVASDDGAVARCRPDGRKAVFLGDLVDRGPGIARVLRLVMSMVEGGDALCVPGNHDMKLHAQAARQERAASPTASRRRSSNSTREPPEFRAARRRVHRRARQPLRARRRQAGGRPRRHEGGDAGPRLGPRSATSPLRRDDRRDRRVRPAGPLRLGRRVPRPGDGRLRPHARAGARVAQPHDQHRHRLRVRRQA